MVRVDVDGSVLDRIAKIMPYLRLGSSGKVLKKKKKEKDAKGKILAVGNGYDKEDKPAKVEGVGPKNQTERESILPPPPPLKKNPLHTIEKQGPAVARTEDDDIFVGEGVNYEIPVKLIGRLQNGTVFLKKGHNDDEEELFEFKIDEEQVIDGLDRAASAMKKGEVALLSIAAEYAFV